jgi:hypothetical protein
MSEKENILALAKELVRNGREKTHGDVKKNHEQIAEFWNIYLDDKLKPMESITSDNVAMMMALLKISRSTQGNLNVDDFVDGAAYIAIAGELRHDS